MSTYPINLQARPDGWYAGTAGDYIFQAKVYDTGSQYGINGGRVSKLEVWTQAGGISRANIRYDRGWDKKPTGDAEWALLWDLLEALEALPSEVYEEPQLPLAKITPAKIRTLLGVYIEVCQGSNFSDHSIAEALIGIFDEDDLIELGYGDYVAEHLIDFEEEES